MYKPAAFLLISACVFFNTSVCGAKEIRFEATVDRNKVSLDQQIVLSLTFDGTQSIPAPEFSKIEGFHNKYLGPSTMVSIVNGKMSASITHKYILIPLEAGEFRLGPFSFDYRGKIYAAPAITIEVVEGRIRAPRAKRPPLDDLTAQQVEDKVFVVIEPSKTKAYLNEPVPLKVKLYVHRVSVRDIELPRLDQEGFSVEAFGEPRQYREELAGAVYDVLEFDTVMFGTRAGALNLGPALLKCNFVQRKQRKQPSFFDDFFGKDDPFDDFFFGQYVKYPLNLKSAAIPMEILPLPAEGRPDTFHGAVGEFSFEATAEPAELKAGDPITLKMVIMGQGNLGTVTCPAVDGGKTFKVYDPQVTLERNAKIFEQVLIPVSEKADRIPRISFSFFNPKTGGYKTISKGPIPIKVAKSEQAEDLRIIGADRLAALPLMKKEVLGRDMVYIKELPGRLRKKDVYLYRDKAFLITHIAAFLCFLFTAVVYKWRRKLRTDIEYARRLRAPQRAKEGIRNSKRYLKEGKAPEFYETVFKTLQEYLGNKFHLPSAGITASIIDEILKPRRVDPEKLNQLRSVFSECDMARFASSALDKGRMQDTFNRLREIIDYLERRRLS